MATDHTVTIGNFFKIESDINSKSYMINASDYMQLNHDNDRKTTTGVHLKLDFQKCNSDLLINIALYCWSNDEQMLVQLKQSIWAEDRFGSGIHIEEIENYYKKIVQNLLEAFSTLKYIWQLKEILYRLDKQTFIFHYKLLNSFGQEAMEKICKANFNNYPILNIPLLRQKIDKFEIPYLFLPQYINGFYIDGIEVSIDLDESDFAIIETDISVITPEECLHRLSIY